MDKSTSAFPWQRSSCMRRGSWCGLIKMFMTVCGSFDGIGELSLWNSFQSWKMIWKKKHGIRLLQITIIKPMFDKTLTGSSFRDIFTKQSHFIRIWMCKTIEAAVDDTNSPVKGFTNKWSRVWPTLAARGSWEREKRSISCGCSDAALYWSSGGNTATLITQSFTAGSDQPSVTHITRLNE